MQMIRRLRRKLIAASMLSLTAVLALILSAANFISYRQIVSEAETILDVLEENNGEFPGIGNNGAPGNNDGMPDDGDFDDEDDDHFRDGRLKQNKLRSLSAETPFESRYFTIVLDADGNACSTALGRIAAVDSDTAVEYARKAANTGKSHGFLGDYRYRVCDTDEEGQTLVIFLDRGRNLSSFRTALLSGLGISILGILAVFALITLFSGRIIRPFVENYEKQRRFITDAGHELKTPLAIIEADSDVLEMDLGEDNEWLTDIRKQTHRLSELTANLIFLSRSEEGGSHFQKIDFPVSDVVEEAAESYRGPAIAQEKDYQIKIQPMLSLYADENAIRQLVGILMDNALKYTPEKGSITLSLKQDGRFIRLAVQNTAENIRKEQLPHLFDRFYRTDSSRNSATGGYGIGLSIAQAIVTGHKGQIKAESPDGKSLTITASFPATDDHRTPV